MYRVVIVCLLSMTLTVVCGDENDTWKKGCIDRCKKRTQPDSDHEPDGYVPGDYGRDDHYRYGPGDFERDTCVDKCDDCVWRCVDFEEFKGPCAKSCLYACERCGQRCSQDEEGRDEGPSGCRENCREADMECKGDNDCVDANLKCIEKYGEHYLETCLKCKGDNACVDANLQCRVCGDTKCMSNCFNNPLLKRNGDSDGCRQQGYFSDMASKLFRDLLAPRRHK